MEDWSRSFSGVEDEVAFDNSGSNVKKELSLEDPICGHVLSSKMQIEEEIKNLEGEGEDSKKEKSGLNMMLNICKGDIDATEAILDEDETLLEKKFPEDSAGFTAVIFAICFDQYEILESLLEMYKADPDEADTVVKYSPLMWAVYLGKLDMITLLMNNQADPYNAPCSDGKNALSVLNVEDKVLCDYFSSHNIINTNSLSDLGKDDYFKRDFFKEPNDAVDELSNRIKMQTIGAKAAIMNSWGPDEAQENGPSKIEEDDISLSNNPELYNLKEFDYEKLYPEEFIKFTDSDIPSLLDYIFNLRTTKISYQHDTKIPAAVVFQLIRYSHQKVQSIDLTEFFFECFVARLRSVTNTKSGVFNIAANDDGSDRGPGDIVLLGYWLSVLQFLHFYFAKIDLYQEFPKFLQEMINLNQSLIMSLSFAINSRLNLLIDDCLLNFTNLVDVSSVAYAKDWSFFKNKKKVHPNNFEDIMNMLYPPSERELMKPSPIRYIQVISALHYVLRLHNVDKFIQAQVISEVFYFMNAMIFNRIISTSKYCSRAKAIQIRLNISAIEDWLRSHNQKTQFPGTHGTMYDFLGKHSSQIKLQNVLDNKNDTSDPHHVPFYYNSIYKIGTYQLQPTIELLQWLQCMTQLRDEESLIVTVNQFSKLNYFQLLKVANKLYRYEVDEPKFAKALINLLKTFQSDKGMSQIEKLNIQYMTQSKMLSKEEYIYINPNCVFGVSLLSMGELITNYGPGYGGIHILKAKKYQPSLPYKILDDIEEIITNNKSANESYDYDGAYESNANENGDENLISKFNKETYSSNLTPLELAAKGDSSQSSFQYEGASRSNALQSEDIFTGISVPTSLPHKGWQDEDFETNPW